MKLSKTKNMFKEKKIPKKELIISILVLLLTIGFSVSFFVGNTNTDNNTIATTSTTTIVEDTKFLIEGTLSINDLDINPGHKSVSGIRITATGDQTINYNLVWNGTNELSSINYTVYKTDNEVNPGATCTRKTEENNSITKYYEECNITNLAQLGSAISSGTISANSEEQKIILKDYESITATKEGSVVYYYVVLEFPNKNEDQNIDMNKTFDGVVTIEQGEEYVNPSVVLTTSTVIGENNWYKSVDVTGTIDGSGDIFTGKYCVGNTVCIPTTNLTITDKTFNVSIPSEAYPQVVCTNITDKRGTTTSECTDSYKVDGVPPTVSITGNSSDENSITINVTGNDTHSKIDKYYYKIGTGNYEESTSTSKTFSGLDAGTNYTVYVYAKDTAGNTSTVVSKNISTITPTLKVPDILSKYSKDDSRSGEITAGFASSTPTTVYSKEDYDGTSYVFAGVNPNNWVKMGNIYYRILRFNGNGSMRLIYQGTSPTASGTLEGYTQFNESMKNNMYVGLQYTSGNAHGSSTNSTILGETNSTNSITLYGWYNSNIKSTYGTLIDTSAGFCSDRTHATTNTGIAENPGTAGKKELTTYYRSYLTYAKGDAYQTTFTPDLTCPATGDKLELPVGLITMDEYTLAGGGSNKQYTNPDCWLVADKPYWTMSPSYYNNGSLMFSVTNSGSFNYELAVTSTIYVRPVINLKSTTAFEDNGADGTSTKPYVVKIN